LGCFHPASTIHAWNGTFSPMFHPLPWLPMVLCLNTAVIALLELPKNHIQEVLGFLYKDLRFRIVFYTLIALMALLNETTVDSGVVLFFAAVSYAMAAYQAQSIWLTA